MAIADRLHRLSLRWRILLSFSAVLVALILSMLLYVNYQANRFVNERMAEDLIQGRARIETIVADELNGLRLTADLVASIPQLKALLGTDVPTIKDFLASYQN